MELFEFASQVATPDYVAAKIASSELMISGCQMAVAIELSIIVICAITALVAWRKEKYDGELIYGLALAIAAFAAIVMMFSLLSDASGYQELAAWSNDPVTEVATKLATNL